MRTRIRDCSLVQVRPFDLAPQPRLNPYVATVCGDSRGVIVGNFKVSDCSTFKVRNEAQSCTAQLTPCGGYLCQEICQTNCFDTYQYAGKQMDFDFCFEEQCE